MLITVTIHKLQYKSNRLFHVSRPTSSENFTEMHSSLGADCHSRQNWIESEFKLCGPVTNKTAFHNWIKFIKCNPQKGSQI